MTSTAVTRHAQAIRQRLRQGVATARELATTLDVSQPTISRALASMSDQVVRMGAARSIQYALLDERRAALQVPVYHVGSDGRLRSLGQLLPVWPEGFVMQQADGLSLHSEGPPWWLLDSLPQGYLGRAFAHRFAQAHPELGLPPRLADWSDNQGLLALLHTGEDLPGNLLLGDGARTAFLAQAQPIAIAERARGPTYARLALAAERGEVGASSAAGEQPKFTTCVLGADGPRHVIVKFSARESHAVSARWRDLLLAEHLALRTLSRGGVSAAQTSIVDHRGQRFLEVQRFDRMGARGRRALHSLAALRVCRTWGVESENRPQRDQFLPDLQPNSPAIGQNDGEKWAAAVGSQPTTRKSVRLLDAEFVGQAGLDWPQLVQTLAQTQPPCVTAEAAAQAALLWAYGQLIGNTDMHHGNLSFMAEHGRPYALAPAYDMLPMGFAPGAGGALDRQPSPARISALVPAPTWHQALALARDFERTLLVARGRGQLTAGFAPCLLALGRHLTEAQRQIERLG